MIIYKYPLGWVEMQAFEAPAGMRPLTVRMQNGVPTLWAMVDQSAEIACYKIRMYGTGMRLPENPGRYLGTVQHGEYVLHFFGTM